MNLEASGRENLDSFARGLSLLRHALIRGHEALNVLEKEGALRRFEYCLDVAWKAARDFLEDSGLRIAPVTPRETLRQAAAAGIVADGQLWIDMLNHRTLLAHNYDGVVIGEVTRELATRYFPAMEHLHRSLAAETPVTSGV